MKKIEIKTDYKKVGLPEKVSQHLVRFNVQVGENPIIVTHWFELFLEDKSKDYFIKRIEKTIKGVLADELFFVTIFSIENLLNGFDNLTLAGVFECPFCKKAFKKERGAIVHMELAHNWRGTSYKITSHSTGYTLLELRDGEISDYFPINSSGDFVPELLEREELLLYNLASYNKVIDTFLCLQAEVKSFKNEINRKYIKEGNIENKETV